jgi:hypothetical protein
MGRPRAFRISRAGIIALAISGVLVLVAAGFASWLLMFGTANEEPAVAPPTPQETVEPVAPQSLRFAAMGDMLPHDTVNLNAKQADGTYDYGQFFVGIQPLLENADAIFCNQEVPSAGEAFGITGYPVFNAPEQFAIDLRQDVGCNVINLANNHSADLGPAGITKTREVWDSLDPLSISGTNRSPEEQNTIVYSELSGVNIALVSFAEYSNNPIDVVSLNTFANTDLFDRLLTEARQNADIVLVSMHWGTEDSHQVNATQAAYAQRAADLGADVILGTGPHVLQPATWLSRPDGGRTLVWYSLGNMLSTQLNLNQRIGVVATFDIDLSAETPVVTNPIAHLTYMHYDWTAQQEAAGDLLSRNNLSLNLLANSADLLATTRFQSASVQQILEQMTAILGPEVTVVAD